MLVLISSGVIRDSSCVYMAPWQSYKCFGLNYRMLVIESLDSDTETRRLSPVAVLGDKYVDLINGKGFKEFTIINSEMCQDILAAL